MTPLPPSLIALCLFLLPSIVVADSVDTWHVVNRKPESQHLNDVRLLHSGRCVVVGDFGTIRVSGDNGASWSYPQSPTTRHLKAVTMIDELIGVSVGDGGVVVRTEDGGVTWREVESPVAVSLLDIAFGEGVAVAVGRDGTIIRSDDRGRTWTRASGAPDDSILVVAHAGTDRFLAGTSTGGLLVGSNGGSEWRSLDRIIPPRIVALSPVDDSTWYVAGTAGGDLYRTDDRGESWRRVDPIDTNTTYGYVRFFTSAHGYRRVVRREFDPVFGIYAYRPYLEETRDSGATWASAVTPGKALGVDLGGRATDFLDTTAGLSVGLAGSIEGYEQEGIDEGLDVRVIQGQIRYHWADVDCDDRGRCVVVGYRQVSSPFSYQTVVERSTDGGNTWSRSTGPFPSGPASPPDTPVLKAVFSIDENRLVAGGDSGLYARSVDGGSTWEVSRLTFDPVDSWHYSIDFADPMFGAMTSGTEMAVTDDGGDTWSRLPGPAPESGIYEIIRTAPDRFVAKFHDSLSFSVDSGNTWESFHYPALMGPEFRLDDIDFSSGRVGWAAGVKRNAEGTGIVMKSMDSGRTWVRILEQRLPPGNQGFYRVAFADDDHGIAIGRGTVAYITSNGGADWKMLSLAVDELPSDSQGLFYPEQIAYRNPALALAVNRQNGIILRYRADISSIDRGEDDGRTAAMRWELAPNPATDRTVLTIGSIPSSADLSLKLYDLSGRLKLDRTDEIRTVVNGSSLSIDIGQLPAGRYLVIVGSGDETTSRVLTVVR